MSRDFLLSFFFSPSLYFFLPPIRSPLVSPFFTDPVSLTWRDVECLDRQFLHLFFFRVSRMKKGRGGKREEDVFEDVRGGAE